MASEEEQKNQGDEKGFAGLSSMVSDVDATVASAPKQAPRSESNSSSQQFSQTSVVDDEAQSTSTPHAYPPPAQSSGGSSSGKWLFVIAVVIGVIWLANQSNNTSTSRPAYSPGTSSTSVTSSPAWPAPAAQPQAPSRPTENKPSVGRNNVLTTAQIRYCLAERIRLDAAEAVLNNYDDTDVNRYNGYVDDYNSRCGEFLYRPGSLESARRDVEVYRGQLQAEGRGRFIRSPSAALRSPAPSSQTVSPSPDATVQGIQRRLNELGYDAGPADGLAGARTRNAISSFQRDNRINIDGVASPELLQRLRSVESIGPGNNTPSSPGTNRQSALSPPTLRATSEEMQSIEMVCLSDKVNNGPAAYKNCVERHLASLTPSNRRPDLSGLSPEERQSIEMVCLSDKVNNGPAAYNRCIGGQLASLGSNSRRPDLSRLSSEERQSIEMVCLSDKVNNGPAAYNKCIQSHLASIGAVSRRPDLSRLSTGQRQSIEMACLSDKVNSGPAAYNRCIEQQLSRLGN